MEIVACRVVGEVLEDSADVVGEVLEEPVGSAEEEEEAAAAEAADNPAKEHGTFGASTATA